MKHALLICLMTIISSLSAFVQGDSVPDFAFQELNFRADTMAVDTLDRNLHAILNDGRTVIIYFFSITFS